jgi:hypothetical protein
VTINNTGGVIVAGSGSVEGGIELTVNGTFIVESYPVGSPAVDTSSVFTVDATSGGEFIDATNGTIIVRNSAKTASITLKKAKLTTEQDSGITLTGSATPLVAFAEDAGVSGPLALFVNGSISIVGPGEVQIGSTIKQLVLKGVNAVFSATGGAATNIEFKATSTIAATITGIGGVITLNIGSGSRSAELAIPAAVTATLVNATIDVSNNPGKITVEDMGVLALTAANTAILKFGEETIDGSQGAALNTKKITTGALYDADTAGVIANGTPVTIAADTGGLIIDMISKLVD